jgi:hypothetical protein
MRKIQTAALCCASAFATLAMSQTAAAQIVGENPALDAKCLELMKPSPNSGYTTLAINVSSTSSSSTVDTGPGTVAGIGTPTYGGWTNFRGFHVNGQSVNIFAYGDRSLIYPDGYRTTVPTLTTTTTITSGECHVHKPVNGNGTGDDPLHPGFDNAPPGLQTDEPVSVTSTTTTPGFRTFDSPGPWTDPTGSVVGGEAVICISPGRVPGTWRNQNGYTGVPRACSRAWYDTLGSTPSVSVPTI